MGIYYDKILGSFVGAAAGDALGAITETYSEVRAPQTSSAKISRPMLSVPSQCRALGA